MIDSDLLALAREARDRIVSLAQGLVQTPSLTGQEGKAAALVEGAMRGLHYDEVRIDEAGNVLGTLTGSGGRTVLLHSHLDIVDPGDPAAWRYPPYAGEVADGYLWGRGASDTKASVATQVVAVGLLREAGITPPGEVHVAAVVGEEVGGFGTRHLLRGWQPDVAVIGEPSANTLRRGHRGRFEFVVTFHGRSAHASAPDRGLNPHYSMARFLTALRQAPMAHDAELGASSVVPTLAYVDQKSSNVIPAALTVHLDWRSVPSETPEGALALLERMAAEAAEDGIRPEVRLRTWTARAYTGLEQDIAFALQGCHLAADAPEWVTAQRAVEGALGRPVPTGLWTFTTDGSRLHAAGVPCVGFGPGEEAMAHVVDERVAIDEMVEATAAYMALALALGAR
ncbi:MAG TPA: M20/M25/M40 family metallo-hydrolase [Chloroflexi bacterium]|jgi:succinyl-diaminopimelate desuccinylase|nr:M20/M25/M40 family metallo-hydrolase [Chloroflexota bacterium]